MSFPFVYPDPAPPDTPIYTIPKTDSHTTRNRSAQQTEVLAVPKNMKLLAIPLFELYDNAARCVWSGLSFFLHLFGGVEVLGCWLDGRGWWRR
jgi:hypothetical protein